MLLMQSALERASRDSAGVGSDGYVLLNVSGVGRSPANGCYALLPVNCNNGMTKKMEPVEFYQMPLTMP